MILDFVLTLLNAASVGLLVSAILCRLSRTYKFYFKSSMLYLTYFLTSLGRLSIKLVKIVILLIFGIIFMQYNWLNI